MKTSELVTYLIKNTDSESLYASMPLLGWSFGSDNMSHIKDAVMTLEEPTTIIIRQFTKIDSSIPYKNDPTKFLPMKRIIAGLIDKLNVAFLSPSDTRISIETCHETGNALPPIKDYSYVDVSKLIKI
ncbi:MAG: hypothetical protein MI864_28910 [Pseudomonadales bacterium]|uniref:Uncharacterized protein n=1 Tax=Oleiphilus messinensis TaxID=141451 RepID=A0A1Y0I540_9GAMM|nr:hypothetical protein [Oleiphilus messinensis]ARU55608.1 hypothetical protein OLMES_1533 [Oleiphilus messinensis]MCG8614553.1 hypothetical protein [Pseudomonadales bacterium]